MPVQSAYNSVAADRNVRRHGCHHAQCYWSNSDFRRWCNQNDIKMAQQQVASFNTAGDSGQFTPGTSARQQDREVECGYGVLEPSSIGREFLCV